MEKRVYTNSDLYHYIQKMDSPKSPFHEQYQSALQKITTDNLDKPIDKNTMWGILMASNPTNSPDFKNEQNKARELLGFVSSLQRVMQNPDGSYSIYPYLEGMTGASDLLDYYCLDLHMSLQDMVKVLEPFAKEQKEKLENATFQNYYGIPDYLMSHSRFILEAMEMLRVYAALEDQEFISTVIAKAEVYYQSMQVSFMKNLTKEQYDLLRDNYGKVLECENQLIGVSSKVWQAYAAANNGVFIHELTNKIVESDQMDKICVSFYSDNAQFLSDYANTGYAYPMDITSLFTVGTADLESWTITKKQFIEEGFPEDRQYDGTGLFYMDSRHSRLFPPQYVEKKVLDRQAFAEVVVDNRYHKLKPLYCFYKEQATPEQIAAIQAIAAKQGLEVKSLKANTYSGPTYK